MPWASFLAFVRTSYCISQSTVCNLAEVLSQGLDKSLIKHGMVCPRKVGEIAPDLVENTVGKHVRYLTMMQERGGLGVLETQNTVLHITTLQSLHSA